MDWSPIFLTLKLAAVTTVLLFIICLPLAWWLAHSRFRGKPLVEALVSMPLVLPPSVLGFYLLITFSPENGLGHFLRETFGLHFVFSFEGLVLASLIYSLPFMVHPIQAGFQSLPTAYREVATTLGKGKLETLFRVLLPNMRGSLLTGIVLSFAHTTGEFGVVLMIGGNIEGETRVASIAVYDEMEAMHYGAAHEYALFLLLISFAILVTVYMVNKRLIRTF
ncbi:MAG TPA: molybdate ABC transporter permease subunit [Bacteroidetes bacterium]|nr:molybdate ABC transporter permease subunit [Bacteroidota bacterium]